MEEESVISPFEIGVCSALALLAKVIALDPNVNKEQLVKNAQAMMDAMPKEPTWVGGKGIHQAALQSIVDGVSKGQK